MGVLDHLVAETAGLGLVIVELGVGIVHAACRWGIDGIVDALARALRANRIKSEESSTTT